MISDDTQIDLVINKLTRAQYQALSLSGLIDENQLYMITDDPTVPQIVSSMISSYYPKTETSSASEISVKFNDLSNYYTKSETSSAENLKTKFETLSTYTQISAQLSNDGYLISASLSSYYPKTETSSSTELSVAFDKKVRLGTFISGIGYDLSSSDLSIVRIDDADYYRMVALSTIDPNVVYVLSSGIVNGQGERIINVGTPVSADDAVNKAYVDSLSNAYQSKSEMTAYAQKSELTAYAQKSDTYLRSQLSTFILSGTYEDSSETFSFELLYKL